MSNEGEKKIKTFRNDFSVKRLQMLIVELLGP